MDSTVTAALITGIVTIIVSAPTAWYVARTSARNQERKVQQEERESDRQRLAIAEARIDSLWAAREADALIKRRLGDHIDLLEAHIWRSDPPPPPPRPDGI